MDQIKSEINILLSYYNESTNKSEINILFFIIMNQQLERILISWSWLLLPQSLIFKNRVTLKALMMYMWRKYWLPLIQIWEGMRVPQSEGSSPWVEPPMRLGGNGPPPPPPQKEKKLKNVLKFIYFFYRLNPKNYFYFNFALISNSDSALSIGPISR